MIRDFIPNFCPRRGACPPRQPLSYVIGVPFSIALLHTCAEGVHIFEKNCGAAKFSIVAKSKIYGVGRVVSNFLTDKKGRQAKNAGV
jgi:hypothetical protein